MNNVYTVLARVFSGPSQNMGIPSSADPNEQHSREAARNVSFEGVERILAHALLRRLTREAYLCGESSSSTSIANEWPGVASVARSHRIVSLIPLDQGDREHLRY